MDVLLLIFVLSLIHGVILSVTVVLERRNPAAGLAWIVTLLLLPGLGAGLYWVFGRRNTRRRLLWRRINMPHALEGPRIQFQLSALGNRTDRLSRLVQLGTQMTGSKATLGNRATLLENASVAYPRMLQSINEARSHILLESYIFRNDEAGQLFTRTLAQAAKRGVVVRVLLDGVGSISTPQSMFRELEEAGGRVLFFSPPRLLTFPNRLNFRNHRKILVVDGCTSFTGGLNIGSEYLGNDASVGFWRDTHLMLEGNVSNYLQHIFLEDWMFATDDPVVDVHYCLNSPSDSGAVVQIIPSGPDLEWRSIQQVMLRAIGGAQERVYITSPYFIPDAATLDALCSAALAGLDVRVLVPGSSDLPMVLSAGRSYYQELVQARVKLYEYSKGFIHAKTYIIDDWMASVGSANMDIRSFHLNYEVNAFIYDKDFVRQLQEIFLQDLGDTRLLTHEDIYHRSLGTRFVEGLARLASPLL